MKSKKQAYVENDKFITTADNSSTEELSINEQIETLAEIIIEIIFENEKNNGSSHSSGQLNQ
jgi:hypothetical protein